MKKTLAILMVVALVATAAFAEVNFGAWGRGFFVPVAGNGGDDMVMTSCVGWWYSGPRVGFTVSGSSDNAGFKVALCGDNSSIGVVDSEANIWMTLGGIAKLTIGGAFDDTLRGNGCFGAWDWLRPNNITKGEDLTFMRISEGAHDSAASGSDNSAALQGAIISLFPVDGLYIVAGLKTGLGAASRTDGGATTVTKLEDVFKNGQYAIGYTVPDLLQIKAQWIGKFDSAADETNGVFNAAVNVKAVANLNLEVGAFINTADDADKIFALFASYSGIEKVGLNLLGQFTLGGDAGQFGGENNINVGVGGSYDLGDGMGIVADVRVNNCDGETGIGFLAGFEKGFSNGKIGIGFEGVTNGNGIKNVDADIAEDEAFCFAVPVKVEYWF